MWKSYLLRALFALAAVSVVALPPTAAHAQDRKRKPDAKGDAKGESKKAAKDKAKEAAKDKAKEGQKARADKAEKATAEKEAQEEAKKNELVRHARYLGVIERLAQIAEATNNDELRETVARLRDKEERRHKKALGDA